MAKALTGQFTKDESSQSAKLGNQIVTADITASPKTSPLTVSNAAITLAVPTNAISVTFFSTSNDVRVSDVSGVSTYFVLKASVLVTIPCAKMSSIYVLRDGGSDATLQFFFTTL